MKKRERIEQLEQQVKALQDEVAKLQALTASLPMLVTPTYPDYGDQRPIVTSGYAVVGHVPCTLTRNKTFKITSN